MANFALPSNYRTWQFQVNQTSAAQGSYETSNGELVFSIKESLKGNGSWTDAAGAGTSSTGNWVVKGSSNGAGAFGNDDDVDRWASFANVIWANSGTNHSWIVLEQTGMSFGSLYILIDCVGTTRYALTIWSSTNPFTGGTATAAPTSVGATPRSANFGGPDSDILTRLHVMKSSDGKATRAILCRNGWDCGFWAFEEIEDFAPGNTTPYVMSMRGDYTSASYFTVMDYNFLTNGNQYSNTTINASPATVCYVSENLYNTVLVTSLTIPNEISSTWPMFPVRLFVPREGSYSALVPAVKVSGALGRMRDLWWVPATLGQGDQMPAGGGKNFSVLGDICLPWNTTAISLS